MPKSPSLLQRFQKLSPEKQERVAKILRVLDAKGQLKPDEELKLAISNPLTKSIQ
jgi:hypothetical protein